MKRLPSTNIKLLFILAANVFGGGEAQTHSLLAGLAKRFDLVLLTHRSIAAHFSDLELELVEFERFGLSSPYDYRCLNVLAYARAIASTVREQNAGLVHAVMHNSSLFLAVARWLRPRGCGASVGTGSLHGSLQGYFDQRGAPPTFLESMAIRMTVGTLRAIMTPSAGVSDELIGRFHASPEKVHPIHNGFDLDAIREAARQPPSLKKSGRWLVTSCRLSDQKDFNTLLKGFSQIQQLALTKLLILGEGPLRGEIEGWIRDYGLEDKVLLLGFQKNPFCWIRQADVFLLSSFYEGFGNVLVEAGALGIPSVASNCPWGPAEIIESGISGHLFQPGNDREMAKKIDQLLGDEDVRQRMGAAARVRSENFSRESMIDRYARIFERLHVATTNKSSEIC